MADYRPNVAAILQRDDGRIFVAERNDVPGAWQFPQGGVDPGEDLMAAVRREVREEIGIGPDSYELRECRTGYRYRFPPNHRKGMEWDGQEQTYFLCRFHGTDADLDLEHHSPEFSRFQWIRPERFEIGWLPEFKREVYRKVFRDFFRVELK